MDLEDLLSKRKNSKYLLSFFKMWLNVEITCIYIGLNKIEY